MKYKLINSVTKKETICDKVTIDGFDYYINNDKLIPNYYVFDPIGNRITKIHLVSKKGENFGAKKVIATTNPNIDIPKVIDEVERLASDVVNNNPSLITDREKISCFAGWIDGYLKSKKTHSNSDEDLIEFAEFVAKYTDKNKNHKGEVLHAKSKYDGAERTTDLLQLWKEQKPKIVYYNE